MQFSVKELKEILRNNELQIWGNKSILVDRILENLDVEFDDEEEVIKEKLEVEQSPIRKSPARKRVGLDQMPTEIYYKMAESMSIPEVLNLCLVNKGFDKWICKQNSFWRKRLLNDFAVKYTGENPKQEYRRLYDGGFIIDSIRRIRSEIDKRKRSGGNYDPLDNLIEFPYELNALFTAYAKEKGETMTTMMKEEYIDMKAGKKVPYVMTFYIKLRIGINRFFARLSKTPINKFTIDRLQNVESQSYFGKSEYISIRTLDDGWEFSENIFSEHRYKGFEFSIVFDRQRRQMKIESLGENRSTYPEKGKHSPITFEIFSFLKTEIKNRGLLYNLLKEWSSY